MKNKPLVLAVLTIITLASAGCSKTETANEYPAAADTNSPSATNAWQKTKETATNAWASTKEATKSAWDNVKDSTQTTMDYAYDKKDAFVVKAQADLDALDLKIKELSDKAAAASDSVKADAQARLQDLRDQRTEAGKKLDEAKNSTEANWADMKAGFQHSYDEVKTSVKEAWQWLADKMNS